jgi:hypothetical protein
MLVFVRKQLRFLRRNDGSERREIFMPWMEGVARNIQDPVARLRFLRIAAPFVGSESARGRRRAIPLLLLSLAAIVCVIVVFAAGHGKSAAPAVPRAPGMAQSAGRKLP